MSTTTAKVQNPTIKLQNVRLSFPCLWTAKLSDDAAPGAKPKFEATFILNKAAHAKEIKLIQAAILTVSKSPVLKGKKPNKTGLRDGSEREDTDGYGADVMFIAGRTHKRPSVVDRKLVTLTEEDGKPYAGCYVNATIEIYPYYHSKSGPGVTASLRAVQFVKDGDPFGEKPVDAAKEFEDLGDDDGVDADI